LWSILLKGYGRQNDEAELLKTLDLMEDCGSGYTGRAQYAMVDFYARPGDVKSAKL
jgi:pentatricopeptide repeat protein